MYSNYYHEFTIGFNAWMIVAPLLTIVCGLLAAATKRYSARRHCALNLRYHLSLKFEYFNLRARRYETFEYERRIDLVKIATIISAIVFAIMLIVESGDGIVQYNDNMLRGAEDPVWSILILPFEVMFAAGAYGFISYYISQIMGSLIVVSRHDRWAKKNA